MEKVDWRVRISMVKGIIAEGYLLQEDHRYRKENDLWSKNYIFGEWLNTTDYTGVLHCLALQH